MSEDIIIENGEHYIEVHGKKHKLDNLTLYVDRVITRLVGFAPDDKREEAELLRSELGDLFAELLGKATAMSAQVVTKLWQEVDNQGEVNKRQDEEIAELKRAVEADQRGSDG